MSAVPGYLDLFAKPPQLTGVAKSENFVVRPIITQKNSGQIIFNFNR